MIQFYVQMNMCRPQIEELLKELISKRVSKTVYYNHIIQSNTYNDPVNFSIELETAILR
ncbi:MAG TPA: hypothetical protein PK104_08090 [Spirochaetota bacterium]|nr:hypothetical protein [Spirochaetota bacterium]